MTEVPANCVGRIVWGHPGKPQVKKDVDTKQPKLDAQGQQIQQWVFGVAYTKADFQQFIYPYMMQEAQAGYPQGTPPKFSWKYVDGDGVDHNGKPFADREGYAGCYVLTISTEAFAPPVYKADANGNFVQLTPEQIKTGDYVACALNLKVNVPKVATHTPGLYVNPVGINHVGYGQEIHNGPDANQLFGGHQYQLPPGASATPLAPTGAGMPQPGMPGQPPAQPPMGQPGMPGQPPAQPPMGQPGMPGQPPAQPPMGQPGMAPPMGQPGMAPPMGQPGMAPPMGQPGMAPPAHDFVNNAGQVPPGTMPGN